MREFILNFLTRARQHDDQPPPGPKERYARWGVELLKERMAPSSLIPHNPDAPMFPHHGHRERGRREAGPTRLRVGPLTFGLIDVKRDRCITTGLDPRSLTLARITMVKKIGGDSLRSASLASSAARRRARSARSPSSRACGRRVTAVRPTVRNRTAPEDRYRKPCWFQCRFNILTLRGLTGTDS
jgi:hypothetical protein